MDRHDVKVISEWFQPLRECHFRRPKEQNIGNPNGDGNWLSALESYADAGDKIMYIYIMIQPKEYVLTAWSSSYSTGGY